MVPSVRWPDEDGRAMIHGDAYRQGAAVCRRGHVETAYIDPNPHPLGIADKCSACGARILVCCPQCELRIRGDFFAPGVIGFASDPRPSFCDGCGSAFPWATRQERIYELENLLDEQDIDEADKVVIQDALAQLQTASLSERDERQAWTTVARRAGKALGTGPIQRVLEGLVSAAIRQQLGL